MYALEIDHSSPETRASARNEDLRPLRARLVRHARQLVRDRDLAEDLVQDTLLAVLHGEAPSRGEASLTTWAVGILKHKAADWYRSPSQRLMFHFVGDADDDNEFDSLGGSARAFGAQSDPFLAPDRVLEERQLHWAVERCIARLSAQARQVFAMREQLGYETDEVCRCLDISQDHCRMLLHRARVALRSFLRDRFLETRVESSSEGSARRSAFEKNSRHVSNPRHDQLSDCTT